MLFLKIIFCPKKVYLSNPRFCFRNTALVFSNVFLTAIWFAKHSNEHVFPLLFLSHQGYANNFHK